MATRAQVLAAINGTRSLLTDHHHADKARREAVEDTLLFLRTLLDITVFKDEAADAPF